MTGVERQKIHYIEFNNYYSQIRRVKPILCQQPNKTIINLKTDIYDYCAGRLNHFNFIDLIAQSSL
ncbi:hypothetical protein [Desulfosarcina sp.]|uniref:hypothetical protein n=1 Tax=Desulfosarcina sp. TaxID=2027861 RepID=UPI0035674DBD